MSDKRLGDTGTVVPAVTALVLISGICVSTVEAQTSCPVDRYLGTYRDDKGQKFSRCEYAPINCDWKDGGPQNAPDDGKDNAVGKTLGPDHFSASWTGNFRFEAVEYVFRTEADDGIRVWIDEVQLIDDWKEGAVSRVATTRLMTAGVHKIRVEYFERSGPAVAKFWWRKQ
jgi:hypothetical protein